MFSGEFPFLTIQEKNRGFVGKFPPLEMFLAKHKKPPQLLEFLKFYNENKDRENWDFDKEIIEYCISDVRILAKTVVKYDKIFRQLAGFSPLTVPTLPAAAMYCFRYFAEIVMVQILNMTFSQAESPLRPPLDWVGSEAGLSST